MDSQDNSQEHLYSDILKKPIRNDGDRVILIYPPEGTATHPKELRDSVESKIDIRELNISVNKVDKVRHSSKLSHTR